MFTRKPEDGNGGQGGGNGSGNGGGQSAGGSTDSGGAAKLPLRSRPPGDVPPALPARPVGARPEIVRRARDYGGRPGEDRNVSSFSGGSNDRKQLIVGRDIALSGQISSCEKLVVEGRVEANITECSELEVAEPGWQAPRTRSYVALGLLLGAYYFWTLYVDLLPGAEGPGDLLAGLDISLLAPPS